MKNLPGAVTYPISIEESKPDAQQEAQYPSIKLSYLHFSYSSTGTASHIKFFKKQSLFIVNIY